MIIEMSWELDDVEECSSQAWGEGLMGHSHFLPQKIVAEQVVFAVFPSQGSEGRHPPSLHSLESKKALSRALLPFLRS